MDATGLDVSYIADAYYVVLETTQLFVVGDRHLIELVFTDDLADGPCHVKVLSRDRKCTNP